VKNIHHRPALLWRFRDSGTGYKTTDLLTYLLNYLLTYSDILKDYCEKVRLLQFVSSYLPFLSIDLTATPGE